MLDMRQIGVYSGTRETRQLGSPASGRSTSTQEAHPMASQIAAQTPTQAALARAFDRAVAERLVAYPIEGGAWVCKTYTLRITGPHAWEVSCSCPATGICKHM